MKKTTVLICLLILMSPAIAQWQLTTCPYGTGDGIFSVATNGNYVFAGIEGLGVFVSSNNGTTWSPANNGLTSSYITSFTVKGSEVFTGTDAGVFYSSTNGSNWTAVNNGLTMTFVTSLSNYGTSVYAGAGVGQIFRTDNNGTLWTETSSGLPMTLSAMTTCFAFKDGNVFAGMTGEGVYKSSNNGQNWTVCNGSMDEPVVHSLITSGNNLLAATLDGLYVSPDNGSNWNLINLGFSYLTTYSFAQNGSNLYMGTEEGVFLSTDNGITWDSINTGLTSRSIQSMAINSNYLYANERVTGIWRRPLSEIIGRAEIGGLPEFTLSPNPATTTLTISGLTQKATAEVYDLSGKLLLSKQLNNPQLDINSLAKGLYFIKLITKEGSAVRKFVKE
jgi:photosystem II stability/assembly factor-like uncharacterized protein